MATIPTFFLGNVGQKNVFYDILGRKNAFLGYKDKKFKNSKNWLFFLGVNPWFWSKNGHFSNLFFRQFTPGKCLLRFSRKKKTPFLTIKTRSFKNSKNWQFPKGVNPWFWSKNGHFSNFVFRQLRPEQCLFRYSRTKKNAVLDYKTKKFKQSKTWHFSKGVNQWFWSKNGHFSNSFF